MSANAGSVIRTSASSAASASFAVRMFNGTSTEDSSPALSKRSYWIGSSFISCRRRTISPTGSSRSSVPRTSAVSSYGSLSSPKRGSFSLFISTVAPREAKPSGTISRVALLGVSCPRTSVSSPRSRASLISHCIPSLTRSFSSPLCAMRAAIDSANASEGDDSP